MSERWTFCIDCEETMNHRLVKVCEHCGSTNVEQEQEEYDRDLEVQDYEAEDDEELI